MLSALPSAPTILALPLGPKTPPALLQRLGWALSPAPQLTDIRRGLVPSRLAGGPAQEPGMLLLLGLLPSKGEGVIWPECAWAM